jgi:hydrogenase expression/formation protein HypD
MKHLSKYREPALVAQFLEAIRKTVTRDWTIMQICGSQTHSLVKNGLLTLLPNKIDLVHGPGWEQLPRIC